VAEDIIKIRKLFFEDNMTKASIARMFNTGRATIRNIINGKSYKWVV
jgi:DNA invertase Pin-like site-specific DNA recombinase